MISFHFHNQYPSNFSGPFVPIVEILDAPLNSNANTSVEQHSTSPLSAVRVTRFSAAGRPLIKVNDAIRISTSLSRHDVTDH